MQLYSEISREIYYVLKEITGVLKTAILVRF
jgi:hypothetical protein